MMMVFVSAMDVVTSGMRNRFILLSGVALLLSCSDGKKQTAPADNTDVVVPYSNDKADSVFQEITDKSNDKAIPEKKQPATSKPQSSSSTYRHYDDAKNDNMRGFDPASEDDMDDNGMTRYMEANDEEAWD